MSSLRSKNVRILLRSLSTSEMIRAENIFLAILSFAANVYLVHGSYNEQCPVPDLAQLCESDCTDAAVNCIIDCGDDQGTVLL